MLVKVSKCLYGKILCPNLDLNVILFVCLSKVDFKCRMREQFKFHFVNPKHFSYFILTVKLDMSSHSNRYLIKDTLARNTAMLLT